MIKAILFVALVAIAFANEPEPQCNSLANGNFNAPDTVDPWMTTSYMGGTSTCNLNGPDQCELLQANALNNLSNSGRISVGRGAAGCVRPDSEDSPVGMNVYQENIGMCRGLVLEVDVGMQDRRNGANVARQDTIFSIVVGRDAFELNSGNSAVVGTPLVLSNPTEAPFINLQQASLSATWNGPDSCIDICPQYSCYAVGLRFARNENINSNVRLYMDNFMMTDVTPPTVSFTSQTQQATSCGGQVTVTLEASASDNCCEEPTLHYLYNDVDTPSNVATFSVGCTTVTVQATDSSGNMAEAVGEVCITQPEPTISCSGPHAWEVESCWSSLEAGVEATPGINCDNAPVTYSPSLDSLFRLGVSHISASFTQADGINQQTWTASCDITVQFTLCCSATDVDDGDKKRSAKPTVAHLSKF